MAEGRSSFEVPRPASTMARARSPRTSLPCRFSTSKTEPWPRSFLSWTRLTPAIFSRRCWAVGAARLPVRGATSIRTDSAPRARACRFWTESVSDQLALLMMMTRSQVCSTSGRMWVLRMMVWSPARLLMRSRVSLICLGSRPAVGSSRIEHVGIVDDGLGEADALAVALGELAEQLHFDVGDGAAVADVGDAACSRSRRRGPLRPADEGAGTRWSPFRGKGRRFGEIADAAARPRWTDRKGRRTRRRWVSRRWAEEARSMRMVGGFAGAVGAEESDDVALLRKREMWSTAVVRAYLLSGL